MEGLVSYINHRKYFGFIVTDEGESIFFHFSQVINKDRLDIGDTIEFETQDSEKENGKLEAIKIKFLRRAEIKLFLGQIDWFDNRKGYGLAKLPSRKEVFVHKSGFKKYAKLSPKDYIQFSIKENRGKDQAFKIQKMSTSFDDVFLLGDEIKSQEFIIDEFQNSTLEIQQGILNQQRSKKTVETILSHFIQELDALDKKEALKKAYTFLKIVSLKMNRGYQMSHSETWDTYKFLLNFIIEKSSLEEKFDFWLLDSYSNRFFSDEFFLFIKNNHQDFDDDKIKLILSKKNEELNKNIFKSFIQKNLPVDDEDKYLIIKTYLNELAESDLDYDFLYSRTKPKRNSEYDHLYDYIQENSSPFYQCKLFVDGYCENVNIEHILNFSESFQLKDILDKKNYQVNEALEKYIIDQQSPIDNEDAYKKVKQILKPINIFDYEYDSPEINIYAYNNASPEFQYKLFLKRYYPEAEPEYILENISQLDEYVINQILIISKTSKFKFKVFSKQLEAIEQNDDFLDKALKLINRSKNILSKREQTKLGKQAAINCTPEQKYQFWRKGIIDTLGLKDILPYFLNEDAGNQRDILEKVTPKTQEGLILAYLMELGNVEDEDTYIRVLQIVKKRWYNDSIFKKPEKIIQAISHFFTPYYLFRFWYDGITKSYDIEYVESNFQQFSESELIKILKDESNDLNSTIVRFKLTELNGKKYSEDDLSFFRGWFNHLNDETIGKEIIADLIKDISPLLHLQLWLNNYTDYTEQILNIYFEQKDELDDKTISKCLKKNQKELNQLIAFEKINQFTSSKENDNLLAEAKNIYELLWKYEIETPNKFLQTIFYEIPIPEWFNFGLEILNPLSKEYTNYKYQGKTFLHISINYPNHIEEINNQYDTRSVFYYKNCFLTTSIIKKITFFLRLYMLIDIRAQFQSYLFSSSIETSDKYNFLRSIKKFEEELKNIEKDFDCHFQYEQILQEFIETNEAITPIKLWIADLTNDFDLLNIIHHYFKFENQEQQQILSKLLNLIPLTKSRKDTREREKNGNRQLLISLFKNYKRLMKAIYPEIKKKKLSQQPQLDVNKIEKKIRTYLPINNEETFEKAYHFFALVQDYNIDLTFLNDSTFIYDGGILNLKFDNENYHQLIHQNSLTPYSLKFWVYDLINIFDYNNYSFYYFTLSTKERKTFNKKARAVMGDEIKSSMLKKRIPWKLIEEREDNITVYEATWRSIWFLDNEMKVCINAEPEFSRPFKWEFSGEKFNFLYDYILGRRMTPLKIYASGNTILKVEGLEELEEVIFKAELEREIRTGVKSTRGEGENRIPINMVLRNKCIQYLNQLQLKGLEPTHILERAFRLEATSFSVDLSLLFSIPLKTSEVALIWESLELEKSKATHIFKCTQEEHEDIKHRIENYLSQNDKVRSSFNSAEEKSRENQTHLRYHGRVDHDNFNFSIWLDRLYMSLPELDRIPLPDEEE